MKGRGARPTTVNDGPSALEALRQAGLDHRPFSVALIDAMMPGMNGMELARLIQLSRQSQPEMMVLLTSGGAMLENDRARELGISGSWHEPVRQSELYNLRNGRRQESIPTPARGESASSEPEPVEVVISQSLKILLAEDHLINQKVAVAMLEKLGHQSKVVPDGRKAVEVWRDDHFDLILMDVQMPDMDGFEAVASIREIERSTGGHIPIVALTAHAMKGDRERCLLSGFDDYLSKPIRSTELREVLARWSRPVETNPGSPPEVSSEPDSMLFDRRQALIALGGDEALLVEVVSLFLQDWPRLLGEIDRAIESGDFLNLTRLSHTARGLASTFALTPLITAALSLEQQARAAELDQVRQARGELQASFERVRPILEGVISPVPVTSTPDDHRRLQEDAST